MLAIGNGCMFTDFFLMVSSNLLFIKIAIVLCRSFYGPHRAMGNVLIFKRAQDKLEISPNLGKEIRFTGPC